MSEEMYTIAEIAWLGFDKFSINSNDTKAFEKQIRKKIKENSIESVGIKKTKIIKNGIINTSRNNAKAYSENIKDKIINILLFEYLKNQSNDEAVQAYKSQLEYEEIAANENDEYRESMEKWQAEEIERQQNGDFGQYDDEIGVNSQSFISKKDEFISEALYSFYFSRDELISPEQEIITASALTTTLQSKFVRDKIMGLHFEFDEKKLLEDMNEAHWAGQENAGFWSGDDIRLFDNLRNWKNYIKDK